MVQLSSVALTTQDYLFNSPSGYDTNTSDGYGVVTLDPASGATTPDNVPLQHLLADLDDLKFIGGGHHRSHC